MINDYIQSTITLSRDIYIYNNNIIAMNRKKNNTFLIWKHFAYFAK